MRTSSFVALALSTALAGTGHAQYRASAPPVQPVATADQLAAVMRRVAAAPTDVFALVSAGELSIKLDDMSAAAAFFARAEKIDPRNGRIKAGMAAILVRAERPGEALRYFQMAERFGHPASRFASDRGLAFDLLGEQERAQRDYRLALRTAVDDETVRRYALSLGISGRQALALEQLEPLTRRQDRAAWRVRAFVLAMNGDVAGASTIATTMMPRGMAGGLQPFFERLPSLLAADRAFAVHFGEVRPTPARLADARMKPGLAPLGPDPYAPVQVATARPAPPPVVLASRQDRRRDRTRVERRGAPPGERRAVVSVAPRRKSVAVAAIAPDAADAPVALALRARSNGTGPTRSVGPMSVQVASPDAIRPELGLVPRSVASIAGEQVQPADLSPLVDPQPVQAMGLRSGTAALPITPAPVAGVLAAAPAVTSARPAIDPASPGASARGLASGNGAGGSVQVALAPQPMVAAPAPVAALAPATIGTMASPSASADMAGSAAVPTPVTAVRSEDSILARIVASITIPGEELGVIQPERRAVTVAAIEPTTARVLAAGEAKAASQAADRAAATRTIAIAAAKPAVEIKPTTRKGRAGSAEPAAKEDEAKAKPKTAAEKRLADRKKAAGEEAALAKAEKAKGKGEPERIWVQVAGGASAGDLPRAWDAAQKKAAALKGRAAYTTPLRATNRVVTGPFKTAAEARAFVNQLVKQGVSAFQFTSATGQKMTKLSAK